MNTNLENKPNKVGEVRKQVKESIMEECRKIVNMTNADFEKEYENHMLDSLRVICALYGIDPVELMKILCDHSARQLIKTMEAEFEQIYNEPVWIDDKSMVEVFCTAKGDTDKLATEVSIRGTKIYPPKGMLIGKVTPIDNSFFVEFVGNDEELTTSEAIEDENIDTIIEYLTEQQKHMHSERCKKRCEKLIKQMKMVKIISEIMELKNDEA